MNEKLDICGYDDHFFYSWVVAQTLVISKKVRTRQSFCAHRLQKIKGNIACDPCVPCCPSGPCAPCDPCAPAGFSRTRPRIA